VNKEKRNRNRANARALKENAHVCPECGERGGKHWVQWEVYTLQHLLENKPAAGFWVCPKFYDPVTGRRVGT